LSELVDEEREKENGKPINQWLLIFGAGWITFLLSITVSGYIQIPFMLVGAALMFLSFFAMVKKW